MLSEGVGQDDGSVSVSVCAIGKVCDDGRSARWRTRLGDETIATDDLRT